MKSNEDNKTWISNIMVRNIFLCLKQVYCCLTFVCVYIYHKLRKTFGKFFKSYSELLSKFGAISFQDYVSEEITHPVFYGDLV